MNIEDTSRLLEDNNFSNIQFIGEGCYGSVYSVKDNADDKEYAANIYNISKLKSIIPKTETDITQFILSQIDSLRQFNATNELITYHKHIISDDVIILILDLYRGTTLAQYIEGFQTNIPEPEIVEILRQIVTGVYNIHENNSCHHNIKPDNIFLLEDKHTIKIGHFGPSNNNDINSNVSLNKIRYLSPEIINNEKCDNKCCDIWSIGIIALDLCFGNYKIYPLILWSNDGINKIKKEFNRDIYTLILLDFIIKCLNIDYNYRINITSLLNHPLFGGIDNINYDELNINDNNDNINDNDIEINKPKLNNATKDDLFNNDNNNNNNVDGDLLSSIVPEGNITVEIGDISSSLLKSEGGIHKKRGGKFKNKLMGTIDSFQQEQNNKSGYTDINLDLDPNKGGIDFVQTSSSTVTTTYTSSEINNNGEITYNEETTVTHDNNTNNDNLMDDFLAPNKPITEGINPNTYDNNNNDDLMGFGNNDNNNNNNDNNDNNNLVSGDLMGSLMPDNMNSGMNIGDIDSSILSSDNNITSEGGGMFKQKLVSTMESYQESSNSMSGYVDANLDLKPEEGGLNFMEQSQVIEIYTKDYTHGHIFNGPDDINTEWPGRELEQSGEYKKLTINCPKATVTLSNSETDAKSGDITIEGGGKYYYLNEQISTTDPNSNANAFNDLLF